MSGEDRPLPREPDGRVVPLELLWILAIVVSMILGYASAAHCQDHDPATPPASPGAVPERHGIVDGVWLPSSLARDVLRAYDGQEDVQRHLHLLEASLVLADNEIALRVTAAHLADLERAELRAAVGHALTAVQSAQDAQRIAATRAAEWWRQPSFWFGVGAALGALTVIVGAIAWHG